MYRTLFHTKSLKIFTRISRQLYIHTGGDVTFLFRTNRQSSKLKKHSGETMLIFSDTYANVTSFRNKAYFTSNSHNSLKQHEMKISAHTDTLESSHPIL